MDKSLHRRDMKRAVVWEMDANQRGVTRFRVIVADRFVLTQTVENGSERPRWSIEAMESASLATQRAVAVTDFMEKEYGAKLGVNPMEVVLHDAELAMLADGGTIPSALRARAFTAFHRTREPS